jgi:hypothetical protein
VAGPDSSELPLECFHQNSSDGSEDSEEDEGSDMAEADPPDFSEEVFELRPTHDPSKESPQLGPELSKGEQLLTLLSLEAQGFYSANSSRTRAFSLPSTDTQTGSGLFVRPTATTHLHG